MSTFKELTTLHQEIRKCTKCPLHKKMPDGCVPVPGLIGKSKIMLVGEALGENEALMQEPFVGLAGDMLNKIIKRAGMKREELTILNTVNCRPTRGKYNRPPTQTEIDACSPWLFKQIELLKPKAIITLGKIPTGTILKTDQNFTLGKIQGKKHEVSYTTAHIFPAYHPSYIMQRAMHLVDSTAEIFKKVKNEYT